MITTKDLESLGWDFNIILRNGGSKLFHKGDSKKEYYILSHVDNLIMKSNNFPDYYEITIRKINESAELVDCWQGSPKDIQDLKRILVETGADMEWLPEFRDEKINDILND